MAVGMGARVTVADINTTTLLHLDAEYQGRIETLAANSESLAATMPTADVLIGAVLVPGAKAPKVISREMIRRMAPGSVAVDVAVDQGGCFETTRPTTHHNPIYIEEGVLHYAVANMPSLTARTSTLGLSNVTLPVLLKLAKGVERALQDSNIAHGLTTKGGEVVHPAVREALKSQV
jgi:alanine dehydrogenase